MDKRFQAGGTILPYLFGATILSGSLLSGALSKDTSWLGWHFSRLGEGGSFSAAIFNITLLIAGLIMAAISFLVRARLKYIPKHPARKRHSANIYFTLLLIISICLIALSVFPFDQHPILHNIAGYSMLLTALALAFSSYFYIPIFSEKYRSLVTAMLALTIVMYTFYFLVHGVSLLIIEILSFIIIFIWFKLFIDTIFNFEQK